MLVAEFDLEAEGAEDANHVEVVGGGLAGNLLEAPAASDVDALLGQQATEAAMLKGVGDEDAIVGGIMVRVGNETGNGDEERLVVLDDFDTEGQLAVVVEEAKTTGHLVSGLFEEIAEALPEGFGGAAAEEVLPGGFVLRLDGPDMKLRAVDQGNRFRVLLWIGADGQMSVRSSRRGSGNAIDEDASVEGDNLGGRRQQRVDIDLADFGKVSHEIREAHEGFDELIDMDDGTASVAGQERPGSE